jgi:hypothetical protein
VNIFYFCKPDTCYQVIYTVTDSPLICDLMWDLGQHTLLGIVVGYVVSRATHFTDYCWLTRGLGKHSLLGIVVSYVRFWATHFTGHHRSDMWGAFINGFKIINNSRKVDVSVSYLLRNC